MLPGKNDSKVDGVSERHRQEALLAAPRLAVPGTEPVVLSGQLSALGLNFDTEHFPHPVMTLLMAQLLHARNYAIVLHCRMFYNLQHFISFS